MVALVAFAVLVGLGMWQLQRATWKQAIVADYTAQASKEPLIALPPRESAESIIYQRAALGGKFIHHQSVQIRPRSVNGKQGYDLVTPLVLYTGEVILVLRGFVPDVTKEFIDQPIGTVAVVGTLHPFSPQAWKPNNDPDHDQWFWIDPQALEKKFGLANIYPLMLVSSEKPLNTPWPAPQPFAPAFHDFHMVYAGIWFSLAFILVVIYVRANTRKVDDSNALPEYTHLPKDRPDDDSHGSGGTGNDPLR